MKNRIRLHAIGAVFLLASVGISGPASAYKLLVDCNGQAARLAHGIDPNGNPYLNDYTVYVDASSTQFDTTERQLVESAFAAWNDNAPGNPKNLNIVYDAAKAKDDTTDQVRSVVRPSTFFYGAGKPAITNRWVSDCTGIPALFIADADTIVNRNLTDNLNLYKRSNPPAPQDSATSFLMVMVHEVGHQLGLSIEFIPDNHEDGVLATMNTAIPSGGVISDRHDAYPHADDLHGLRVLYDYDFGSNTEIDVAASAFGHNSGDTASELLEPPSSVNAGASMTFQFTVENRGTEVLIQSVRFYLLDASTRNSNHPTYAPLGPTDVFLGNTSVILSAGAPLTATLAKIVPQNTAPGQYYLGYKIDPNGFLSEPDNGNNAAVLVDTINVVAPPPTVSVPVLLCSAFFEYCSTSTCARTTVWYPEAPGSDPATSFEAQYMFNNDGYWTNLYNGPVDHKLFAHSSNVNYKTRARGTNSAGVGLWCPLVSFSHNCGGGGGGGDEDL